MNTLDSAFHKWLILLCVTVFAALIAQHLGWWAALWSADATKISTAILVLYFLVTFGIGYLTKFKSDNIEAWNRYFWFSAETMIVLGLIGTVSGFLIMLGTAFADIDVSNTESMQEVIGDMAVGMSTALSTTLVGMICSQLAKFQLVLVEDDWFSDVKE